MLWTFRSGFAENDRVSVRQTDDEAFEDLMNRKKKVPIRGMRAILVGNKSVFKKKRPANTIVSPYVKQPGRRFKPYMPHHHKSGAFVGFLKY